MYFRKDETEEIPTWMCTNSSGAYVARIEKRGSSDGSWAVLTGTGDGGDTLVSEGISMEEAFDTILRM